MGDVRSSPERKNLHGAVEIYRKAFPVPSSRRRLIVKILQTDQSADFVSSLRAKVADRSDVQIIESDLNAEETTGLMAGSSVFLSPHRSEGFGLAIAESLLLGVPALATGWSGNMVFMRDLPELQLKYSLVPVKDPYGVYAGRGLRWANPDIESASERLRQLDAGGSTEAASALKYSAAVRHLEQYWTKSALSVQPWAAFVNPGGHTGSP
jgi:hypothetical protein